jgi:hypothetical protein
VAIVNGHPISRADVLGYLDYARKFYAWANGSSLGSDHRPCSLTRPTSACRRLENQVLARLIEERVILDYAAARGLALTPYDQHRVSVELQGLDARSSGTEALFTREGIVPRFMRQILASQLLVQEVEDQVLASAEIGGPSYHVRKFVVPLLPTEQRKAIYREALDLATAGTPVPRRASVKVEWVASFRVPTAIREGLDASTPGQYVGPFATGSGFLVYQLLGKGHHVYGGPARALLEPRYFKSWLQIRVARSHIQCFAASGSGIRCP